MQLERAPDERFTDLAAWLWKRLFGGVGWKKKQSSKWLVTRSSESCIPDLGRGRRSFFFLRGGVGDLFSLAISYHLHPRLHLHLHLIASARRIRTGIFPVYMVVSADFTSHFMPRSGRSSAS
jgi:hypothetical protein